MSDPERHRDHDRPGIAYAGHPLGPVIVYLALLIILVPCLKLL